MDEQTKTTRSNIICNYTITVIATSLFAALLLVMFIYFQKETDKARENYTENYGRYHYAKYANPQIIVVNPVDWFPVKDKDGNDITNGKDLDWGHFIHPFFHGIDLKTWVWAFFALMCSNVTITLLTILGAALYNTIILHIGRAHKYLNCVSSLAWLGLVIYVWVMVAQPYKDTLREPVKAYNGKRTTIAFYYHIIFVIGVLMPPLSIYQDFQGASYLAKFIDAINANNRPRLVACRVFPLNDIKYSDSDDCKYPEHPDNHVINVEHPEHPDNHV